ncbi:hypothetical protein J3F83DRAFT_625473 [Trichoderma novae-zelandiae]
MLKSLVFGLFLSLGCVTGLQQPVLDIWDVDISCTEHRPVLYKAYNDVAFMAAKVLKDTGFVHQPEPRKDKPQERAEWNRIRRAVQSMFGFLPSNQGTTASDGNKRYMEKILSKTLDTVNYSPCLLDYVSLRYS